MSSLQTFQKPKKVWTACGACKQRKTKCSGSATCDACAIRGPTCIYDVTCDQRRKISRQRNLQDLYEAQINLERHKQLLGGIIAIIRAGRDQATPNLLATICTGVDLSQLAVHTRNARRSDPAIEVAFSSIEFVIDELTELPPLAKLLADMPSQASTSKRSVSNATGQAFPSMGTFCESAPNSEISSCGLRSHTFDAMLGKHIIEFPSTRRKVAGSWN